LSRLQIIDLFPTFLEFWPKVRCLPLPAQIEAWAQDYMAPWPELLLKQQQDYSSMHEDWRAVAATYVFPTLDQGLPDMIEIHRQLPGICQEIYRLAVDRLALTFEMIALFYVGIGCGAGWVTTYDNKPAILFGLENIAGEGWTKARTLRGFIAHEMGHIAHFHWRDQAGLAKGEGPFWQLYSEGFAQWIEQLLIGAPSWHMQDEQAGDWLAWCQENRGWLAAEFLRKANGPEAVRPFFGSWFDIKGYKQTGYFLGCEVMNELSAAMPLRELALLDDLRPVADVLQSWKA
jgi:hypothetical protein